MKSDSFIELLSTYFLNDGLSKGCDSFLLLFNRLKKQDKNACISSLFLKETVTINNFLFLWHISFFKIVFSHKTTDLKSFQPKKQHTPERYAAI